ncbi:MAG: guanylate kinase [Phycisphaerales bacterium]
MPSAKGMLVMVSGPSGVGKTTILHRILSALGAQFSVSATTRPRAAGETDGVDYRFVDEPAFQSMIDRGEFLEYAQVFGRNWYGTPETPVDEAIAQGRIVILDIDVHGAKQVRERRPEVFGIFILPPSETELHRRLADRGREDAEASERRFAEAKREIAAAREPGLYDAFVVNDELERAVAETLGLLRARTSSGSSPSTARSA